MGMFDSIYAPWCGGGRPMNITQAQRAKLISDGVLSKDGGLVLDAAGYDRYLDSRTPASPR